MLMVCGSIDIAVRMDHCRCWLGWSSGTAAVVIRPTERHGRGCNTLSGNRKRQQPNEQRSDQQIHCSTLPHGPNRAGTRTFPAAHGEPNPDYEPLKPIPCGLTDDKAVICRPRRETFVTPSPGEQVAIDHFAAGQCVRCTEVTYRTGSFRTEPAPMA